MAQHYSIIYIYIYISSWLNTRPYAMHAVFAWQAGKARPLPAAAARQVWPHRARLWTPAGQPAGGAATAGEAATQGRSCVGPVIFRRVRHGACESASTISRRERDAACQVCLSAHCFGKWHRTDVCLKGVCESGIQHGRFMSWWCDLSSTSCSVVTADLILFGFSWSCWCTPAMLRSSDHALLSTSSFHGHGALLWCCQAANRCRFLCTNIDQGHPGPVGIVCL